MSQGHSPDLRLRRVYATLNAMRLFKRGRGRPPKFPDTPTTYFQVRVPTRDLEAWKAAAKLEGMAPQDAVRQCVDHWAAFVIASYAAQLAADGPFADPEHQRAQAEEEA